MNPNPYTKNKWCVLANKKCPGRGVGDKIWGCPYWIPCTVDGEPTEGCNIIIQMYDFVQQHERMRGIQAAIESHRNVMDKMEVRVHKAVTDGQSD